jgi:SpoVK/Ycf46/Vps4 family AAA+-type ATPase
MIERVRSALSQKQGARFYILYGPGIEDTFISERHREQTIEEVLLNELRQQGYERIVFTSPHRAIYFLDELSRQGTFPTARFPQREGWSENWGAGMQRLQSGPLQQISLLQAAQAQPQPGEWGAMGDLHALQLLDHLMRETTEGKTALVFMQAETNFRYFEDQRSMASIMGEWSRLPAANSNSCFFLFSANQLEQLHEMAVHFPVPELRNLILNQLHQRSGLCDLIPIPGPEQAELQRLIEYALHHWSIRCDEEGIGWFVGRMAAEGGRARDWLSCLSKISSLDEETARQQGWFSAFRSQDTSAWDELQNMIGLPEVKQKLEEWIALLNLHQRKAALRSIKQTSPVLHMLFTGNPGTGKTTAARLLGEICQELQLLNRGHVVEAKGSDLIADYIGGTAIKTNRLIDQALDGVLFIDEAYALTAEDRGGFGQEAVETLMKRMEDDRHRLMVIAAGYPDLMRRFLEANPGLRRRFPTENIVHFPDYGPAELFQIFEKMAAEREIILDSTLLLPIQQVIANLYDQRDETFGNAGEMRNLVEALERRHAVRLTQQKLPIDSPLTPEDLPSGYQAYLRKPENSLELLFKELNEMVGLTPLKSYLRSLAQQAVLDNRRRKSNPALPKTITAQHLVFSGSPGSGKTSAARKIGMIYKKLGLLRKGHCVEVTRADLVAGYVGQTALKTTEKVKEALDGILFIDEAYTLSRGTSYDFGQEAIDTLVKAMEDYRDRLVIIAAGYPEEMETFLQHNPGLMSRFDQPIPFPNFTGVELGEILEQAAKRERYHLSQEVSQHAIRVLEDARAHEGRNFGNARAVLNMFNLMKGRLAERLAGPMIENPQHPVELPEDLAFSIEDIPLAAAVYLVDFSKSQSFSVKRKNHFPNSGSPA